MPATEKIIVVYGTTWCPDCVRAKRVLDSQHTAYRWVNIEQDPQAAALVQQMNHGMRSVPTIVFPDGSVLVEPSNAELLSKLGTGNH
jgi:mycoredoxin